MKIDVEEDLIESNERNSMIVEDELNNFFDKEEGQNIKLDIELLNNMGYDKKMINKVYILLRPENIERAIDYMTEIDGIYQHDFIASTNPNEKNFCFICKKPRKNHLDFIPEDLLLDTQLNNSPNNNPKIFDESKNNNNVQEDKKTEKNDNDDILAYNDCQVCYDELNKEETDLNTIPCGHLFCTHCWFNYLKTLITDAKVEKIKCMEHECKDIISEEFILKHISENENLVEKYKKFKKRAEILGDKNKKLCPNPDCDSFLQKSDTSKYVECENGHKYCYDCLKAPHGSNPCDYKLEKQFMSWKKGKRVKRCPRCKIYTEKNEGCNHMTCISCRYQWCWLCEGEYRYNHYDSGKCKGLQFFKADKLGCCNTFGLFRIFKCVYPIINGPYDNLDEYICLKYLSIFGFWLFGIIVIYYFIMYHYMTIKFEENYYGDCLILIYIISFLIGLCLFTSFQITFSALISPFILISFIYHKFFNNLLLFFGIADNDNEYDD